VGMAEFAHHVQPRSANEARGAAQALMSNRGWSHMSRRWREPLIERCELIRALNRNGVTFLPSNTTCRGPEPDPILVMLASVTEAIRRFRAPGQRCVPARWAGGAGGRLMAPILELREVDGPGAQVLRGGSAGRTITCDRPERGGEVDTPGDDRGTVRPGAADRADGTPI
jgi:hypothetical protein